MSDRFSYSNPWAGGMSRGLGLAELMSLPLSLLSLWEFSQFSFGLWKAYNMNLVGKFF